MYRIFDQTVLQRSLDQTDKDSRSRPILNCLDFLNSWEKLLVSNVDSFFENQFFIDTTPFLLRPPSLIIVDLQNVIILLNVFQNQPNSRKRNVFWPQLWELPMARMIAARTRSWDWKARPASVLKISATRRPFCCRRLFWRSFHCLRPSMPSN